MKKILLLLLLIPAFSIGANNFNILDSTALPSGAATAAKQPALGTAGVPSTDVITIQGIASGTVVPISDATATYTITQTIVSCTTTSGALLALNASAKYRMFMNVGANDVTISPAATAILYSGIILQSSGSANKQGSSEEFPKGAPTNAFTCITPAGTSNVIVWEGT